MPAVSPKRISWLKFEPRVSNFLATKTATAVLVASAIKKSSLFFVYLLFIVWGRGRRKTGSIIYRYDGENPQTYSSVELTMGKIMVLNYEIPSSHSSWFYRGWIWDCTRFLFRKIVIIIEKNPSTVLKEIRKPLVVK